MTAILQVIGHHVDFALMLKTFDPAGVPLGGRLFADRRRHLRLGLQDVDRTDKVGGDIRGVHYGGTSHAAGR